MYYTIKYTETCEHTLEFRDKHVAKEAFENLKGLADPRNYLEAWDKEETTCTYVSAELYEMQMERIASHHSS